MELSKGNYVNRPSNMSINELVNGKYEDTKDERYKGMEILDVNVKGNMIDPDSDYLFTKWQEIEDKEEYIILKDLSQQIRFPVRKTILERMLKKEIMGIVEN